MPPRGGAGTGWHDRFSEHRLERHERCPMPLVGPVRRRARMGACRAGVTQSVECLLPKQNVAGSSPVSRSTSPPSRSCRRDSGAVTACLPFRSATGHRGLGPGSRSETAEGCGDWQDAAMSQGNANRQSARPIQAPRHALAPGGGFAHSIDRDARRVRGWCRPGAQPSWLQQIDAAAAVSGRRNPPGGVRAARRHRVRSGGVLALRRGCARDHRSGSGDRCPARARWLSAADRQCRRALKTAELVGRCGPARRSRAGPAQHDGGCGVVRSKGGGWA